MNRRITLMLICFLLTVAPSTGQNSADSRATLKGLGGVAVVVEPPSPDLEQRGITAFVVEAEVVRSLKAAGISMYYPDTEEHPPGSPILYVVVTAICDDLLDQASYSIRMELAQIVTLARDPDEVPLFATTWSTGGIGVQGKGWRQLLLEDVVRYSEDFITAYKEANPDGGKQP